MTVEETKKAIKEYLKCYSTSKFKPDYDKKLEAIRFIHCTIRPQSILSDFIRITDRLITRRTSIDYIKMTRTRYLIYFKGSKYPIYTSEKYAKNITELAGVDVK